MSEIVKSATLHSTEIVVVTGDITAEDVDAIVNAANSRLMHGGGVAGAIARAGGPEIQDQSFRIAPIPTGEAGITSAGSLPAHHVIHAVGPVWGGGNSNEHALLRSAVTSALTLAHKKGLATVSLPTISAGIYGFPKEQAVEEILSATRQFLDEHPTTPLQQIRFCNIEEALSRLFAKHLEGWD